MCGICGVFTTQISSDPIIAAQSTRNMMALMERRGPDDEGFWSDNERCGLGFRRLAILDLAPTGHQPMSTIDERFVIVFNGEVYNFRDLRFELESLGIRFRSTGDAEVVLYALATWGTSALDKFKGMFALALYDRATRELLLARDHAGIKPLYYLHTDKGLVFGSQYDQILNHPWSQNLNISSAAQALYLRFGYIPAPYAMLERTHMLEAGSWLTVDVNGRQMQGRFYEFPQSAKADLFGDEAVEALDHALDRAVARHLVSDVPVGVLLSGGIDSPLIAAKAVRHSDRTLKAFTIGVPDSETDESSAAARYATELQLEHVVRMADPGLALELLDDVVEACSEPTADYSIFPTIMVSRLAREHVTVVLSGDGGDELFWGYPSRFGAVLGQSKYFSLPRPVRYWHIIARRYLNLGKATREVLWPSIGRLYQKKHTMMAEDDLATLFPNLPPLPDDFGLFDYDGTDREETAQWLRWNEFRLHLGRILLKVDRASMHNSLEVRVPLLDKDVIDIALRTGWQSCLDLDQHKGKLPLRQVLRRHVSFQTEAKKGFTVPIYTWLSGPLQGLLQEKVINHQNLLGLEINQRHLREMNNQLLAGNRNIAWGLWQLLSLALWQERYLSRRAQLKAA
jgi:asparagine synthase (glutamine-hydrolysing)